LWLVGPGLVEEAATGAVDVGLAAMTDGLDDLSPVAHERVKLLKDTAADEPVARLAEVFCGGIVAVLPDTVLVEDLDENVGADGEREARIEEVTCVDDDWGAAAFCSEGAESVKEILNGAVALEEMHVFDAAEVAVERSGEDDDGDVGSASAKKGGDLGAELAGAKVVVEDRNVDAVEEFGGLFDGGGGNALVAVLAKDGSAEVQIAGFIIEQKYAHWLWAQARHLVKDARYAVGRLNHGHTSL
jgi:hypothetical protein